MTARVTADPTSAPRRTDNSPSVAERTVSALIEAGIDQLYCLPGVQNDDFFDALYDHTDRLAPIHARHEQGAAYMALGAALATGRPQAFCVVPGPGFLNATAALATAQSLGAPVLALVGEIHSGALGRGWGMLHEIPDQFAILDQLTRRAVRIRSGGTAAGAIGTAMDALTAGAPGPVGLEVPFDLWRAAAPDGVPEVPPARPAPDAAAIDAAAATIAEARRPLIVVGSGAQETPDAVRRLAEACGAAVIAFRTGRGVVPASHPLSASLPQGHALWAGTDLVIGLGTRLETGLRQWGRDGDMKVIHVDADPAALTRFGPADIGIEGTLGEVLPRLLEALGGRASPDAAWTARIAATRAETEARIAGALGPQLAWLSAIRAALPPEGILVNELTQMGYVANIAFPVERPRTFLSPGYQGTLGWGVATALGAAHARRDVPVVAVSGDGGALFTIAELATAARHAIPLTLIVFTDNAYGNVRRFQEEKYAGRTIASDLASPDFVALAESFGIGGMRAETPEALGARLAEAIASRAPAVIEVPVGDFPSPWPFIMFPRSRG